MRPFIISMITLGYLLSQAAWSQTPGNNFDAPIPITPKNVISSQNIRSISLDEIGTLAPNRSGFTIDSWNNSDGQFIIELFSYLPQKPNANSVFSLNRKLLLAIVEAPKLSKNTVRGSFLYVRLKHLARMGNARAVEQLIDKIPQRMRNSYIYQFLAASQFIDNQYAKACQLSHAQHAKNNEAFWHLATITCLAYNHNLQEAQLQTNVFREAKGILPESFGKLIQDIGSNNSTTQHNAKLLWKNIIIGKLLTFAKRNIELPAMRHIYMSNLSNSDVKIWWNNVKQLDTKTKLYEAVKFSSLLQASGQELPIFMWQDFLLFALNNNIPPPTALLIVLLDHAGNNKRQAEVALLSAIAIGKQKLPSVDQTLITAIVRNLNNVGLHNDAKELALEAILDL